MVPEMFRKEKRSGTTPSMKSGVSSAAAAASSHSNMNTPGSAPTTPGIDGDDRDLGFNGIPRLEQIMKQQKLQQQHEMKIQQIHEDHNPNDDVCFSIGI